MCIVFFIFGHPKYKLILASNRDESLKRPTQTADFWNIDENIIAAIDLATITHINKPNKDLNNKKSTKLKRCSLPSTINTYEKQLLNEILKKDISPSHSSLSESLNMKYDQQQHPEKNLEKQSNINNIYKTEKKISGYGTWLGCTRQGLFSTLTNFREDPKSLNPNAISRGYLVRDFLLLKSLYNKTKNNIIENSKNSNLNEEKRKKESFITRTTTTTTTTTTTSHHKIRMHHPLNQAPEKVLKRYKEEDQLYAMEEEKEKKNIAVAATTKNKTNNNEIKNHENESIKMSLDEEEDDLIDFPYEYMKYVNKNKDKYNGFNLIIGDVSLPEPSVWYIGNKDEFGTQKLNKNTVYGMSNGSLNTYWKKIERGKKLFARAVESHTDLNDLVHKLLNVLSDKKDVPMDQLPKTAFEPKLEKCCAPICIEKERFNGTIFENDYATRTHTVIIIDNENRVTFVEQDQYDTISNNYVMKQQCYVFPSSDHSIGSSTSVGPMNIPSLPNIPNISNISTFSSIPNIPTIPPIPSLSPIQDELISSTNLHSSPLNTSYSRSGMTMPINIPRNHHNHNSYGSSYGNSFHKAYTTSFASDNPYYYSPTRGRHSFDNLYLNYNSYNNPVTNTPMSLSSIESITGNTLTAFSTFNSSTTTTTNTNTTRNNYIFNTSMKTKTKVKPILPKILSKTSNNSIFSKKDEEDYFQEKDHTMIDDYNNNNNNNENNDENNENIFKYDDDYDNEFNNPKNKEDNEEEEEEDDNDYLSNEVEKMSIESSSPTRTFEINAPKQNLMEKIPDLFSCTPITPSVFNFFESMASNDHTGKPIESQYVKRNVHDLSKANIHQFKLKI